MADAVWPPGLPPPQVRTLSEAPQSTVQRTKMSIGPDKVRKRTSVVIRKFAWEIKVTRAQVQIFDDFFQDTIAGGALPFEVTQPRTGETVDARIIDTPTYKPMAPRGDGTEYWTITFQVETFPAAAAVIPPVEGDTRPTQTLIGDDPGDPPAFDDRGAEDGDGILGTMELGTTYTPASDLSWPFGETNIEDATQNADELAGVATLGATSLLGGDPDLGPGGTSQFVNPGGALGESEA